MASQENNQDAYFAQLAEAMVEFDLGRNDVALNLYVSGMPTLLEGFSADLV